MNSCRCFAAALTLLAVAQFAAAADTYRRYELTPGASGSTLTLKQAPKPSVGKDDVLVRIRAVSLNHRDLYMLAGRGSTARVPTSDGAGEVVAVGSSVTRFKPGDRVAGTFFERWVKGTATADALASARGGGIDGVLAEMVSMHQDGVVKFPEHLSFEEAATLPCAAVTVWNALFASGNLQPGDFVLLEGTGGVSIFGLQFAAAAGAKPLITSSSDAKLERAKALGAVGTVNYRTNANWEQEIRKLTGGAGVAHVLEVGGKDTLPKALASIGLGGRISLIGGLTGFDGQVPAGSLTNRMGTVSGIYVGSREHFEAMNAFIARHKLKPVIDRVFAFEEAPAAFKYLESGSHFGKVVIKL
jgi:NADPH:quinone reductase-like Zn-dependent oxidoreductase